MKRFKKKISQRQLDGDANHANPQNPTGPRTPEGKAVASRNAFVPTLPRFDRLMTCEDRAEYRTVENLLRAEFSPRSNTEEMLFQEIVNIHWSQRRFRSIETALLRMAEANPDVRKGFNHVEGVAMAALAFRHCVSRDRSLQVLSRDLARVSRELDRTVKLYIRLHGPLEPPEPVDPPVEPTVETDKSPLETKKIGPHSHKRTHSGRRDAHNSRRFRLRRPARRRRREVHQPRECLTRLLPSGRPTTRRATEAWTRPPNGATSLSSRSPAQRQRRRSRKLRHLAQLLKIQRIHHVRRLMIAGVETAKQPYRRDAFNQERKMIAPEKSVEVMITIMLGTELEAHFPVGGLDRLHQVGTVKAADNIQQVVRVGGNLQHPGALRDVRFVPGNHVEIDHRARAGQRTERVGNVIIRTEHQLLFRAEDNKQQAPLRVRLHEQPRKLDHRHRARGIVVGAGIEMLLLDAEMVVMRGKHDRLAAELRVRAFDPTRDVRGLAAVDDSGRGWPVPP